MLATSYEAHKIIKSFGLIYESINACSNGCVLFRNNYKHAHVCLKCNSSRFMEGSTIVPWKVL
jgi:hypothetical protein